MAKWLPQAPLVTVRQGHARCPKRGKIGAYPQPKVLAHRVKIGKAKVLDRHHALEIAQSAHTTGGNRNLPPAITTASNEAVWQQHLLNS